MKNLIYIALLGLVLASCEDVIDLNLDEGASQLVVDAFLTNDSTIQTVRLTQSAAYFSNIPTPAENNASVKLYGPSGITYNFIGDNQGNYAYNPNTQGKLDSTGFTYTLEIQYDGNTYTATSTLNPVPVIDSISRSFEEEEVDAEEGYYTQFWARDNFGREDFYWIRAFKNGNPIDTTNPSALILSQDAAFGGNAADGFVFIVPIRAAITNEEEPFEVGDTSSVELLSINEDAFEFLQQVITQSNNGGLFATPPANIRSNIKDATGGSQDEVLGVFSISEISRKSLVITPE